MKVRILSGNQKGLIVEQAQTEAESNIATGFAEAVVDGVPPQIIPDLGGGRGPVVQTHEGEAVLPKATIERARLRRDKATK